MTEIRFRDDDRRAVSSLGHALSASIRDARLRGLHDCRGKQVTSWSDEGSRATPSRPNALKLSTFLSENIAVQIQRRHNMRT